MNNKKTTKKALLSSVVSLLLCFTMLLGTTMAWFTDTVVSSGNKIQSGTLDVALSQLEDTGWVDITEQQEAIFHYDKWEPGFTDVQFLQIRNDGNLALQWEATLNFHCELTCLIDVIEVYVKTGTYGTDLNAPADFAEVEKNWTYAGTLYDFIYNFSKITNGVLLPDESADLGIALHMQEEAGNAYQNVTLGDFDILINATQWTYEEDSFDDQYDAMAKLPSDGRIEVWTITELQDACMIPNADIYVMADLYAYDSNDDWEPDNSYGVVSIYNNAVTINLNDHNIYVDTTAAFSLFDVTGANTSMNLIGDGEIITQSASYTIWASYDADVVVRGVDFTDNCDRIAIMYTSEKGSATIDIYDSALTYKNYDDGVHCGGFNAANKDNHTGLTTLHEGVLLSASSDGMFRQPSGADDANIVLENGCELVKVTIDNQEWYQVTKIGE